MNLNRNTRHWHTRRSTSTLHAAIFRAPSARYCIKAQVHECTNLLWSDLAEEEGLSCTSLPFEALVDMLGKKVKGMIRFKKLGPEVAERLHRLPQVFSEHPEVVIAYLFGSFAKGEVKPLSDIDIAYLLDLHPSEDPLDKDLELQAVISRVLGTDEVDCYLLNKAPLPFQYEVIRTGKVIGCRDPSDRKRYEDGVKQAYERRRGEFEVTKQQLLQAFED